MNLKEENEKLRELLLDVRPVICDAGYYSLVARIDNSLSHQHGNETVSTAQDEQQPVAVVKYGGYTTGNQLVWGRGAGLQFLPEGTALYASVIPHLLAVAYLDIGVGGYMDLGTDLSEESLKALPWGRHMLAIIGTYGADGYVPAIQRGR